MINSNNENNNNDDNENQYWQSDKNIKTLK